MSLSIRRILVYQDDSKHCGRWTAQARDFALAVGATLTGVHIEPPVEHHAFMDTDIGTALEGTQSNVERERNARVRQAFSEKITSSGLAADWLSIVGDPVVELRRSARFFDMVVLGYPKHENRSVHDHARLVEHAAVGSGRPVLVLPEAFEAQVSPEKVAVCWDGSREATRALHDAMQFLKTAKKCKILVAEEEDDLWSKTGIEELEKLLQAHGTRASIEVTQSSGATGEILLEKCIQFGADLIVLGAYGHSRLRALVLGSVTKHMLRKSEFPLVFSH